MNSIHDDLKAYLDNELPEGRRLEVEQALAQDPELKKEADFYRLLSSSIAGAAKPIQVEGAEKALASKRLPFIRNPWVQAAAGAFAVFALAAVFFPVFAQAKFAAKNSAASAPVAATMERMKSSAEWGGAASDGAAYSAPLPEQLAKSSPQAARTAPGDSKALSFRGADAPAMGDSVPGRQIIRTASLTLRVEEVSKAARSVESLARKYGGFVTNSNLSTGQETPSGFLEIRVDSRRYSKALEELRSLGVVQDESSNGSDVTEQIVDMEARMKTLRAEEDSLRTILSRASRIGDILSIRDRLTQVRAQIESYAQTTASLKSAAALATISVSLQESPKVKSEVDKDSQWADDAWANATNALSGTGRALGSLLIYAAVYSVVWVPALVVIWVLARRRKP